MPSESKRPAHRAPVRGTPPVAGNCLSTLPFRNRLPERRADIHETFLRLGCSLICLNYLPRGFYNALLVSSSDKGRVADAIEKNPTLAGARM